MRTRVVVDGSLLFQKTRLKALLALAREGTLPANELATFADAAYGTLSGHMRKLEEAGFVTVKKTFVGRIPQTRYTITHAGREALEEHLREINSMIPS